MQVSAEIRWFWTKQAPHFAAWFLDSNYFPCPAGGGSRTRTDIYLRDPSQAELGLKRRGNKDESGVEVKVLVAVMRNSLTGEPFSGDVEIWTKCASASLTRESLEAGL